MTLGRALIFAAIVCGIIFPTASSLDTLKIDAVLDTTSHQVAGSVEYKIPLGTSSGTVEFQLFPNVYSTDSTAYLRRSPFAIEDDRMPEQRGEMTIDSVLFEGQNVTENLKIVYTRAIIEITDRLPATDKSIRLFFRTTIPSHGDRLTYRGDEYLLDGWYPRPAYLQDDGTWYNPYYGGFCELTGNYYYYDVTLKLPQGYVIAAAVHPEEETQSDATRNVRFRFGPAHDFALVLSPNFMTDTLQIDETLLKIFFHRNERAVLATIKDVASKTVAYMEEIVGPYEYEYLNFALIDFSMAGGIELPALIVLHSGAANLAVGNMFRAVIVHETIHQWFYGMVGTNQVERPWMDEAVSEYFTSRVLEHYWGHKSNLLDFAGFKLSYGDLGRFSSHFAGDGVHIAQPAYDFLSEVDYFSTIYSRGSMAVATVNNLLGDSLAAEFWKEYYRQYLFGNPTEEDFLKLLGKIGGKKRSRIAHEIVHGDFYYDNSLTSLENERVDSVTVKITVTLRKRSSFDYPIDYWVFLSGGDTLKFVWDGNATVEEVNILSEKFATGAIIDPERKYAVDLNWLNNSLLYTGSSRPAMRLSSGIMFLLESLFTAVAGL